MNRRWAFTDLEFVVLCHEVCGGELPEPFCYTADIPTVDEFEVEKRRVLADLEPRRDARMVSMLAALARPDTTIVAKCWDDNDWDNPQKHVRVHAAFRETRGYLLTQRPGRTFLHSGGFDIVECHPGELPRRVLEIFPPAEQGRLPRMAAKGPEQERDPYASGRGSMISDNDEPEDDENYRRTAFFQAQTERVGYLRVSQERSKFGPRGRVSMELEWRDLPDDGRYGIAIDELSPMVAGMGTEHMIRWIDEQMDEIAYRRRTNSEYEE